jgi:hypothetical protein
MNKLDHMSQALLGTTYAVLWVLGQVARLFSSTVRLFEGIGIAGKTGGTIKSDKEYVLSV